MDSSALRASLLSRLTGIGIGGLPSGTSPDSTNDRNGGGGVGVGVILACALAGAIVAAILLKAARRRLRFMGGGPRRLATACRRDLVGFLADQRIAVSPSATLDEIGTVVGNRYSVSPAPFVRAASAARFGPPDEAAAAARRARHELRALERELSWELTGKDRLRGALSLRSLLA